VIQVVQDYKKRWFKARHMLIILVLIILATREAAIGRITVQSQPRQIVSEIPCQPIKKLGMVACAYHPSYIRGKIGRSRFMPTLS
jgi:hypothetical protein